MDKHGNIIRLAASTAATQTAFTIELQENEALELEKIPRAERRRRLAVLRRSDKKRLKRQLKQRKKR